MPSEVAEVFESYPASVRRRLSEVRELIFQVAENSEVIGRLTETTKWGEPAYLTQETKVGSTLRLGTPRGKPDHWAVYFNCNTSLVETFRAQWGSGLEYDGNRALLFSCGNPVPKKILRLCIEVALSYHLLKRSSNGLRSHIRGR